MSALRELIAFFGVQVDAKPLDALGHKLNGMAELAMKAGETLGLAFGLHEIHEFVAAQIEVGNEAINTAEMLGVSVAELKEFRYAAYQADVSSEEAATALRFLNKGLGAAAEGGKEAAAVFNTLGVKIKEQDGKTRPALDVMGDIADAFEKIEDPAQKTKVAMEVFGRAGSKLIPLLNQGRKGLAEMSEEFKELTEGTEVNAEVLQEAEHQTKRNETAMKGLKSVVAAQLIPAYTKMIQLATSGAVTFRKLAANSYIVQSSLAVLGAIALYVAASWVLASAPILLTVLGLALLALVIDDIYVALTGGKSVIGDFIDALFGVGTTKEVVAALGTAVDDIKGSFVALYDAAKGLATAIGVELPTGTGVAQTVLGTFKLQLTLIAETFKTVVDSITFTVNAITNLITFVTSLIDKFKELGKTDAFSALAALVKKLEKGMGLQGVGDALGAGMADVAGKAKAQIGVQLNNALGGGVPTAPALAPPVAGAPVAQGPTTVSITNTVHVKGGTTNEQTGDRVVQAISGYQAEHAAVPGGG